MKSRLATVLVILVLGLVAVWAMRANRDEVARPIVEQREPVGVMGTVSRLVVVTEPDHRSAAAYRLETAEAELRRLETILSTWIEQSEISRFNTAAANRTLELRSEVIDVLTLAQRLYDDSARSFDITARPLFELWRLAADRGRLPTRAEIEAARLESSWEDIQLTAAGASKLRSTVRVDVDGIAKGYAIDRAAQALQHPELAGGLVEVGGDLRVFGTGPDGNPWRVAIRSPFEAKAWAEIEIPAGAVCTSGDYARFIEIEGRRFSHIIDPRTGEPTAAARAVTVVGPDAATADAWATALSVLGAAGVDLLETRDGVEALVVTGSSEDFRVHATSGFRRLLVRADFDLPDRVSDGP